MASAEKSSSSKVGFGSSDFKGRGALFDSVSRSRNQHANRMEDEFYCHEDHVLDDFPQQYGEPNAFAISAKQRQVPNADGPNFLYDRVLGGRSQRPPCLLCKFDQYSCKHRHPRPFPKESVRWPSIGSHVWGWYGRPCRRHLLGVPPLTFVSV